MENQTRQPYSNAKKNKFYRRLKWNHYRKILQLITNLLESVLVNGRLLTEGAGNKTFLYCSNLSEIKAKQSERNGDETIKDEESRHVLWRITTLVRKANAELKARNAPQVSHGVCFRLCAWKSSTRLSSRTQMINWPDDRRSFSLNTWRSDPIATNHYWIQTGIGHSAMWWQTCWHRLASWQVYKQ